MYSDLFLSNKDSFRLDILENTESYFDRALTDGKMYTQNGLLLTLISFLWSVLDILTSHKVTHILQL